MEPPAIPWVEVGGIRDYHADKVVSEAREIVHSAAAISDLLRRTVASQLRGHRARAARVVERAFGRQEDAAQWLGMGRGTRSEEHTSELQSRENLVCRLLLEKKNKKQHTQATA